MKNLIILSSKTATAASYSHDYAITWFVVGSRWLYRNSSSANAREVTPTRIHRCDTLWLQKGHGARFVYRGNFIGNCVIKLSHLYTIIKLTIFLLGVSFTLVFDSESAKSGITKSVWWLKRKKTWIKTICEDLCTGLRRQCYGVTIDSWDWLV